MRRAHKIAITVDSSLLGAAEALRRKTMESRSAVFARALRGLLGVEARRRDIERYVNAYLEQPETTEEVEWLDKLSVESLRAAPLGPARRKRSK